MDKEVLQAIAVTLHGLALTNEESYAILRKWLQKSYTESETEAIVLSIKPVLVNLGSKPTAKVSVGLLVDKYRDTVVWGDNKSYRGFVGTLVEEYPKIIKAHRDIMNVPTCDSKEVSINLQESINSASDLLTLVSLQFTTVLEAVGLNTKADIHIIANDWFNFVTNPDMSKIELEFCTKVKEVILGVSMKKKYSGTYNLEDIRKSYNRNNYDFSCTSPMVLLDIAQKVLTTFTGTHDSLMAFLDYKGVELSIDEIDMLIPEASRHTYPEDIYERVFMATNLLI